MKIQARSGNFELNLNLKFLSSKFELNFLNLKINFKNFEFDFVFRVLSSKFELIFLSSKFEIKF